MLAYHPKFVVDTHGAVVSVMKSETCLFSRSHLAAGAFWKGDALSGLPSREAGLPSREGGLPSREGGPALGLGKRWGLMMGLGDTCGDVGSPGYLMYVHTFAM